MNNFGAFVPESPEQTFGEIMGRVNALHDWMLVRAASRKAMGFSRDEDMAYIAALMGFEDLFEEVDA